MNNEPITSKKVLSSFVWRLFERCGAQGVTFVVSIILARILEPSVYGTIALVTVFSTILQVFVDSGLGNALIQKKDTDETDFSTVFYFNIAVCLVLYALIFFTAPYIAVFYKMPGLTPVIRVLCLTLIISGVKNIQQAYVAKNLLFKRFFFAALGGTIGAAVIGIWMAYQGFGVWALVAQTLFNQAVNTVILWFTVKWRPKKLFSWEKLKGLFSYGWKLLVSSLLETIYNDLRQLIIGKMYAPNDLAFYNKGKQFPSLIVGNIDTAINSVLLPTMSSVQDDRERVKSMTRRSIKTSAYIMWPLMVGLGVCAEPVIRLLLTEKWMECVPYLQIFCFIFALFPIHTANLNAIKAIGRSDLFLKLEIIKKIIGLSVIAISMWFGVLFMAYSAVLTSIIGTVINAFPNKKLLNYSYYDQIKDIIPSMLLAAFMGAMVYCVKFLGLNDVLSLLIQIPLGAIIYTVGSKILHFESFIYLINVWKKRRKKEERD